MNTEPTVRTQPAPNVTPPDVIRALGEFIAQNKFSRCLEWRWLSSFLGDSLDAARQVNNGLLLEPNKAKIAAFRLGEIAKARQDCLSEIEALDGEAKRLAATEDR
jgi:hypothetical protein